jgi:hypothetical protein
MSIGKVRWRGGGERQGFCRLCGKTPATRNAHTGLAVSLEAEDNRMRMLTLATAIGAITLTAAAATGQRGQQAGQRMGRIQIGEPFPDLALPDLNGAPRSLAELRGQKVMLHVFASW